MYQSPGRLTVAEERLRRRRLSMERERAQASTGKEEAQLIPQLSGATGGKLGILLPLDYSGMVESAPESGASDANSLLAGLESEAFDAIKSQVAASQTLDDLYDVVIKHRDVLWSIPLPNAETVEFEQALKDAQRESIQVNGTVFEGNVQDLMSRIHDLVSPLVYSQQLHFQVCQDIIRASSRTSSGCDTYSVLMALLLRIGAGDLLTPFAAESAPICINVDPSKGEVVITVLNSFLVRRDVLGEDPGGQGGEREDEKGGNSKAFLRLGDNFKDFASKIRKKEAWKGCPGWAFPCTKGAESADDRDELPPSEESVQLNGKLQVLLSLLDGSAKRRLSITCPQIEACVGQCMVLGSGEPSVNGTFDLAGFRQGAPLYSNSSGVTITQAMLGRAGGGAKWWVIREDGPAGQMFYGQPSDSAVPPDLHWGCMKGQTPPPTLMMNYSAVHIRKEPCWTEGGGNSHPTAAAALR